jgi:hypothetical protein
LKTGKNLQQPQKQHVINTLPSHTSISNAAVANEIYN